MLGRPGLRVSTMYKRKADKVRPVDTSESDGTIPGGVNDWHERAVAQEKAAGKDVPQRDFDKWLYPRTADFRGRGEIEAGAVGTVAGR